MSQRPICIDLDGTLTPLDTTVLCLILALRQKPWAVAVLLTKIGDRPRFKEILASYAQLDPRRIPYDPQILEYIRKVKAAGHPVYLVTGTHVSHADAVALHLGLFHGTFATDGHNLTGANKAKHLNQTFGAHAYTYAGNAAVDFYVWQHSATAVVVGGERFRDKVMKLCPVDLHIAYHPIRTLLSYFAYFKKGPTNGKADNLPGT